MDLIFSLICDDGQRYELEQMKSHAFFEGIDWETLRSTTAPWIPDIKNDEDTSHLDSFEPLTGVAATVNERPDGVKAKCFLHQVQPLSKVVIGEVEDDVLPIKNYDFRRSRDWQSLVKMAHNEESSS
jgi:hypothetical protein